MSILFYFLQYRGKYRFERVPLSNECNFFVDIHLLKFCITLNSDVHKCLILWFDSEHFRLYAVRQKFYELLVNCIPPESILKVIWCFYHSFIRSPMLFHIMHAELPWLLQKLLAELLKKLDADLKHEICHWAAHYVSKQFGNNFSQLISFHDTPSLANKQKLEGITYWSCFWCGAFAIS